LFRSWQRCRCGAAPVSVLFSLWVLLPSARTSLLPSARLLSAAAELLGPLLPALLRLLSRAFRLFGCHNGEHYGPPYSVRCPEPCLPDLGSRNTCRAAQPERDRSARG